MTEEQGLQLLQSGKHHDPFTILGWHQTHDPVEGWILRVFQPEAERVEMGDSTLERIDGTDCFEFLLEGKKTQNKQRIHHPVLRLLHKKTGQWSSIISPYTFECQTGELDLHLFAEGRHHYAWKFLGTHLKTIDGIKGCLFTVWAPGTQ